MMVCIINDKKDKYHFLKPSLDKKLPVFYTRLEYPQLLHFPLFYSCNFLSYCYCKCLFRD